MIVPINHGHSDRLVAEAFGRVDSRESTAEDEDMR